jgi:HSP20 family protein
MSLIRWEPFRGLRRRDDMFEDLFGELLRRPFFEGEELTTPPVEVAESDGDVIVKMEVPGLEKDQLQLTVAEDRITVRGETRKESEEKRKNYYRQEIRYGAFQRAVPLPVEVDAAKASAELKNGMLKVTLPKSRQPKAQEIKVAVG